MTVIFFLFRFETIGIPTLYSKLPDFEISIDEEMVWKRIKDSKEFIITYSKKEIRVVQEAFPIRVKPFVFYNAFIGLQSPIREQLICE